MARLKAQKGKKTGGSGTAWGNALEGKTPTSLRKVDAKREKRED